MCGFKESLGKRPAPKGPRVWQLRAVTGSALRGAHSGVCVVPKLKARPSSRRSCMSASTCDTFRCARCGPSLPRKAKSSEEYPHARCESIRTARLKAANTHPWAAARHRLRTSCVTVRRRRGFLGCPKTQTSSPWEPCSYSFDAIGPKQSSAAMALLRLALLAAVSARSPPRDAVRRRPPRCRGRLPPLLHDRSPGPTRAARRLARALGARRALADRAPEGGVFERVERLPETTIRFAGRAPVCASEEPVPGGSFSFLYERRAGPDLVPDEAKL